MKEFDLACTSLKDSTKLKVNKDSTKLKVKNLLSNKEIKRNEVQNCLAQIASALEEIYHL